MAKDGFLYFMFVSILYFPLDMELTRAESAKNRLDYEPDMGPNDTICARKFGITCFQEPKKVNSNVCSFLFRRDFNTLLRGTSQNCIDPQSLRCLTAVEFPAQQSSTFSKSLLCRSLVTKPNLSFSMISYRLACVCANRMTLSLMSFTVDRGLTEIPTRNGFPSCSPHHSSLARMGRRHSWIGTSTFEVTDDALNCYLIGTFTEDHTLP